MSDPHAALLRALRRHQPGLILIESCSTPWASVTFVGDRHIFRFAPCAPAPDLAEAEFSLPGHIVADVAATATEGALVIEALTIVAA
jgi:hypothetical protein